MAEANSNSPPSINTTKKRANAEAEIVAQMGTDHIRREKTRSGASVRPKEPPDPPQDTEECMILTSTRVASRTTTPSSTPLKIQTQTPLEPHDIEAGWDNAGLPSRSMHLTPRGSLRSTMQNLSVDIASFELTFDKVQNWPGKLWTAELELQTRLDEAKARATDIRAFDLEQKCEALSRRLREASAKWNAMLSTLSTDSDVCHGFPSVTDMTTQSQSSLLQIPTSQLAPLLGMENARLEDAIQPLNPHASDRNSDNIILHSITEQAPENIAVGGEVANDGDNNEASMENEAGSPDLDLTIYDRSRGDIPTISYIIQDIKVNNPETYANLSSNEKMFIKKWSQIEEKILSVDQAQSNITAVHQGILDKQNHMHTEYKHTQEQFNSRLGAVESSLEVIKPKINTLLLSSSDSLREDIDATWKEVQSNKAAVESNTRTLQSCATRSSQEQVLEIMRSLQETINNMSSRINSLERQNSVLSIKLAQSFNSPHFGQVLTPRGMQSSSTRRRQVIPVSHGLNFQEGHNFAQPPAQGTGVSANVNRGPRNSNLILSPPTILHDEHQNQATATCENVNPACPSIPVEQSTSNMDDAPVPQAQVAGGDGVRSTPINSPFATPFSSPYRGSNNMKSSVTALHETVTLLVEQLEELISSTLEATDPSEKIKEFRTSVTQQVSDVSKRCNDYVVQYAACNGANQELTARAFKAVRNSSKWMSTVRSIAMSKESYSRPLGKEFIEDVPQFSNSATMNVFEFFQRFEQKFQGKGTERERADLLTKHYLAQKVALQVTKHLGNYNAIKTALLERYGDMHTLTDTILGDLESKRKLAPGASPKATADFFTGYLSDIYKIKNLEKFPEISNTDLDLHLHSRGLLSRLAGVLPENHRIEFNMRAQDKGIDPEKLQGRDALECLIGFCNRILVGLGTFNEDLPRRTTQRSSRKSPQRAANMTRSPSKSSISSSSCDEERDEGSGYIHKVGGSPERKSRSPTKWYKDGLKSPCPIENHIHEVGTCTTFFSMSSTDRYNASKKKLCFTCMGPWQTCRRKCKRVKQIPKQLVCSDCASSFAGQKRTPYSVLICAKEDHAKPAAKDIVSYLRSWFPNFNPKLDIELKVNLLIAGITPSCLNCTSQQVCSCKRTSLSSPVLPNVAPPVINTHTGEDVKIEKEDLILEVQESSMFCMQVLKVRGKDVLTFYDRGASQHLINGALAEEMGIKVLSTTPSSLSVVGGGSIDANYGLYRMAIGQTTEGKYHDLICQGMSSITEEFPRYDLRKINSEVSKTKALQPKEKLPLEVGGTEVHLLLGIKDPALEPQLLFTLESGVGVYRSKFTDKYGSTICYGGPHSAFTQIHKSTQARTNHLAMFLSSYKDSVANFIPLKEEKVDNEFEDNGYGVFLPKQKTVHFSLNTDSELQHKVFPTPLTEEDIGEFKMEPDHFEDFSKASCDPPLAAQEEKEMLDRFHLCPVLKAKVPLSKLRELLDKDDENDTVTYRCEDCAKCIKCQTSSKIKATSLTQSIQQTFILKSVSLKDGRFMVDIPFTKDPVQFMIKRHGGKSNKLQATHVYRTQCKKPAPAKEALREVHKGLVEKGFVTKIEQLSANQREVIHSAPFTHFYPWSIVYNEGSLSTPARFIVDPTMSGLNLIIAKGDNQLGKITDILIKSRLRRYIWSTDISKLYNQLNLNDGSLPFSLYLYHESLDINVDPEIWVMKTAWYGVASSGGQAEAALNMIADVARERYPLSVDPLEEGRYVDDMNSGTDTAELREEQITQTKAALSLGGLKMKFVARSGHDPPPEASADGYSMKMLGYKYEPKSDWYSPAFAELNFNRKVRGAKKPNKEPVESRMDAIQLMSNIRVTRQMVVSKYMELFDPLGFWEPYKLQLKLEIAELNGMEWKTPLSKELQDHWKGRFLQFMELKQLRAPRAVIPPEVSAKAKVRLLCFSDAAVHAGGTAIYACYRVNGGRYSCSLLASKSRILDGTVPRNELSAIMLMTELAFAIKKAASDAVEEVIYLTDSQIAMCWVFNTSKKLRLYTLNRVSLIRQMINWTTGSSNNLPLFYIDGKVNPADLLTKKHSISPLDLTAGSVWQQGYNWMTLPTDQMGLKSYEDIRVEARLQQEIDKECFPDVFLPSPIKMHGMFAQKLPPNAAKHCLGCQSGKFQPLLGCYGQMDHLDHCDDCECAPVFLAAPKGGRGVEGFLLDIIKLGWKKSLNIMARIIKGLTNWRHKIHLKNRVFNSSCTLCKNLDEAAAIYEEVAKRKFYLAESRIVSSRLSKKKLLEFTSKDDTLWYTGRLAEMSAVQQKDLDFSAFFDNVDIKNVLPVVASDSPVFYAFVSYIHTVLLPHAGVEATMREVSKEMHVIDNPRRIIQRFRQDCSRCRLILKKTMELEMAQHDAARTTIAPPFYNCMADIAYGFKGKPFVGARKECKVYALVIVCILSSATSILALEGLQTQNVIQALERHSARHGVPRKIFVDNGTQLVSLQNNEFSIRDVNTFLYDSVGMTIEVSSAKSHESRGRVEAKVKTLRSMLSKLAISTSTSMTALQWETCFTRIANQLDDLPMAKGNSSNVSDIGWDIITPNRLKLGRNNNRSLSGSISLTGGAGWDDLLAVNRAAQITWYKLFLDRIHHLIPKPKKWLSTEVPVIDDIVLFVYLDSQKSRNEYVWKLGKVIQVHKGGRKVTIAFPEKTKALLEIPKLKTLVRRIKEISVIHSSKDFIPNTKEHYQSCTDVNKVKD